MCKFDFCCCFENKKVSRRVICFWSFLGLASAAGIVYFAILLNQSELVERVEKNVDYIDRYNVREYFFVLMVTLAAIISCFGICGMCFKWMRNRCLTALYGICLMPIWITVISIGGSAIFIGYASADAFQEECDLAVARSEANGLFTPNPANITIDFNIYKDVQADQWMCSRNCPCEDLPEKSQWEALDEITLRDTYGRTDFFQFGASPGDNITFATYDECITRVEENRFASATFQKFAADWKALENYAAHVEYLKFFETEYECSGICQEALFSFSLPISLGQPKTCLNSIKDEVRDSLWWLGLATAGSGLILLMMWIFQYCLWRKY